MSFGEKPNWHPNTLSFIKFLISPFFISGQWQVANRNRLISASEGFNRRRGFKEEVETFYSKRRKTPVSGKTSKSVRSLKGKEFLTSKRRFERERGSLKKETASKLQTLKFKENLKKSA